MALCVLASLVCWGAMAGIIYAYTSQVVDDSTRTARISGIAAAVLSVVAGIAACLHRVDAPKGSKSVSWRVLMLRGMAAGMVIALSVFLSSVSAVVGAIVSTFPVIFMTSMVALWLAQGAAVPVGATGPMMLGATSVQVYAMVVAEAATSLEWPFGAAVVFAWVVAVLGVSLPVILWLRCLAARRAPPKQPEAVDLLPLAGAASPEPVQTTLVD